MSRRQKPRVVVIVDSRNFEIEHIYVGCTIKEAIRAFLRSMQPNLNASYSDARQELGSVLERYQITELEPRQVSIRRGGGFV